MLRSFPLVLVSLVIGGSVFVGGCPGPVETACGLPTTLPEVAEGRATATRSDGAAFDEEGTWAVAPSSSILLGSLDMKIANDETGLDVDDLIADGAFPICVLQGERSETSGAANLVEEALVTNAEHKGGVAILAKDGDLLVGRFAFDMVDPDGATISFSDGEFRVPEREVP